MLATSTTFTSSISTPSKSDIRISIVHEQLKNFHITSNINKSADKLWIVSDKYNLLYCAIPKDASTIFMQLFYAMDNNQYPLLQLNRKNPLYIHEIMNTSSMNSDIINKLICEQTWKSLVILRDPLERIISGWNDKCIVHAPAENNRQRIKRCEGVRTGNFTTFANRIIDKFNNGSIMKINQHFRPQYTFCGLSKYFNYFDYIIYYQRSTLAQDTLQFMINADIDIDKYYHGWGKYHNQSMFDEYTKHSSTNKTSTLQQKVPRYSSYFDKDLLNRLLSVLRQIG